MTLARAGEALAVEAPAVPRRLLYVVRQPSVLKHREQLVPRD